MFQMTTGIIPHEKQWIVCDQTGSINMQQTVGSIVICSKCVHHILTPENQTPHMKHLIPLS